MTGEEKTKDLKKAYQMLEEAQKDLIESEKLASLGRLIAGVTHELVNPLTSIVGFSEILMPRLKDEQDKECFRMLLFAVERCRRIVDDLLMFARKRKPQLEQVDPCRLIDQTLTVMAGPLQKGSIQVEKRYPGSPPVILADGHQLQQVFINLLTNACHALEGVPARRAIEVAVRSDQEYLECSFHDNGPGIAEDNLNKIFEPFFTTKEVGKGTGLGLSICYGIVKEHGGKISVRSRKGEGTTFSVRLPLLTAPCHTIRGGEKEAEKILVVDDEKGVLEELVEALTEGGYLVETAANGGMALARLADCSFDLIISDYLMPKMNGKLFYEEVKRLRPELAKRFVFITGNSVGETLLDYFKQNDIVYLIKPFNHEELMAVVAQKLPVTARISPKSFPVPKIKAA